MVNIPVEVKASNNYLYGATCSRHCRVKVKSTEANG